MPQAMVEFTMVCSIAFGAPDAELRKEVVFEFR
jgi:hypothetical protein